MSRPAAPSSVPAPGGLSVDRVRRDFPILGRTVHGKPLVYLDNAATTQKPVVVLDALDRFYRTTNSNIHRGVHTLSQEATAAYEAARETVRRFIGARETREIVFLRGTTEAINLVAQSYGRSKLAAGDEILLTEMEHHANIVPWQLLCEQAGAVLRVAPIDDCGQIEMDELARLIGPRTRIVAVAHTSNALGTVNPVREIVELAHARGAVVVVDGAQAMAHGPVDVQQLGCDFFAFSGHKCYAPTGSGALYGRAPLLERMPPYQGGGEMIRSVSFERSTYAEIPFKFEAGTPDIAAVVGLAAALDYLAAIGPERIAAHERELCRYATEALSAIPELRIIGTAARKAPLIGFVLDGVHPHDIGTVLDSEGIAIMTGHHCAQPVMKRFGLAATARASFALYNTRDEADALVRGVQATLRLLGR